MGARCNELVHISQDELTLLENKNITKCKYCDKSIWYENTKVTFRNDGLLGYKYSGTTYRTTKNINGTKFPICVCQYCLEKKYPDFRDKNKSKIFNTFNKYVSYAFDIPQELIDEKNKLSVPTLDNCIRKHGEEKGKEVFEEYRRKQAYTNSFEYKHKKYGWTKEQYDEYNKSRSVTIDNLIKRHGEEKGKSIWDKYIEKQSYTSTNEYLIDKFGEDKAKYIILLKSRDINGYILKYGEEEGRKKYEKYLKSSNDKKHYSKFSQLFFDNLVSSLKENGLNFKYCYGDNEHWKWSTENKLYFFDFYIPELRLVIELNGDYWHCNPNKYDSEYVHQLRHMTAKEIWEYDEHRNLIISNEMKYNLEIVWESNIRKDRNGVIFNLVEKIKKLYVSKYKKDKQDK